MISFFLLTDDREAKISYVLFVSCYCPVDAKKATRENPW